MAGIVFLRTKRHDDVRRFYVDRVGMSVWLEQPGISILKHGNMLVGFHEQPEADRCGLLTFFYRTKEEVDAIHERLRDVASGVPRVNDRYRIYHFFGLDPEGRQVEFQSFLHAVEHQDW